MNDDCPLCGGGFYAGTCINGYHPWAWSEHTPWPKLNLRVLSPEQMQENKKRTAEYIQRMHKE